MHGNCMKCREAGSNCLLGDVFCFADFSAWGVLSRVLVGMSELCAHLSPCACTLQRCVVSLTLASESFHEHACPDAFSWADI